MYTDSSLKHIILLASEPDERVYASAIVVIITPWEDKLLDGCRDLMLETIREDFRKPDDNEVRTKKLEAAGESWTAHQYSGHRSCWPSSRPRSRQDQRQQ